MSGGTSIGLGPDRRLGAMLSCPAGDRSTSRQEGEDREGTGGDRRATGGLRQGAERGSPDNVRTATGWTGCCIFVLAGNPASLGHNI